MVSIKSARGPSREKKKRGVSRQGGRLQTPKRVKQHSFQNKTNGTRGEEDWREWGGVEEWGREVRSLN